MGKPYRRKLSKFAQDQFPDVMSLDLRLGRKQRVSVNENPRRVGYHQLKPTEPPANTLDITSNSPNLISAPVVYLCKVLYLGRSYHISDIISQSHPSPDVACLKVRQTPELVCTNIRRVEYRLGDRESMPFLALIHPANSKLRSRALRHQTRLVGWMVVWVVSRWHIRWC